MTEIDIPLFTIFNLICRYNFHAATLVLNPNVSHAAETRANIHHPCSACRGIRQEPLDSSPDILQNFYERLSQSPNIMPLPFLLFSALNISQSDSPPFAFLFCFGFIWLTPSALRKMPPQDPTSQHPLSPDGIYFFFSLANAHPLPFTCRLFLFYTPFRFFYPLHRTLFFSFSRFFVSLFNAYGLKDFYDFRYHLLVSDHFYSLIHIPVVLYTTIPDIFVGYVARYIAKYIGSCARVKCHRSKIPVCRRAKVSREYRIRDTGQLRWFTRVFRVGVIRRLP